MPKFVIRIVRYWIPTFAGMTLLLFSFAIFANNQKPFIVILDWFVNPDHAPMFVAQQQGYFKQAGLKVKFIPPADPQDAVKLVAAGKADIGITYEPQFKAQLKQDLPLAQVGTLIATPLNCLVVLKNGPIHKIEDLKGKKIGYSASFAAEHLMLKTMLKQHGLDLKDVQLINVHYGLTQALLAQKVDAITGAMRNFEPYEMELAGKPAKLFYPEENGMPIYSELIFITNTKEKADLKIKQFLNAVQLGINYLINHPKKTWQTFAKNHPELNNKLNKKAWFATLPRFALRPNLLPDELNTFH
jgi:putative hydroxymethylpyrimidine transport system substrate-binding protein